ncbi:MAG: LPS assembly protein LptD [Parachlamydiaceae bacterium]|nr:LPS assembly protein LptD [Parachlamydiaceae bacterium]
MSASAFAAEEGLFEDLFCKGIQADLKDPTYSDGVLKTSSGGVISGSDLRIQARNMIYTRIVIDSKPNFTIEASGDLMVEFNDYVFVGDRLEYDFQKKTGVIYKGRSAAEPWYFGGERIFLQADGSYLIENGYVTTSEGLCNEWQITSHIATLTKDKDFCASNVKFIYFDTPLFWLPKLKVNLDYIFDCPIKYSARWGGRQGPRVEFIYEIFSWNRLKTFLRFDYRLTRGPGLGFQTFYRSEDHQENFESINYVARDSSLNDRKENLRFRFQGSYRNVYMDKKVSLNLIYDKLSDKDMASDYADSGLDLEYSGMTRLQVRRQEANWIANFLTTVRVNNFQSIKQDLPTVKLTHRPFEIANTKIISDSRWQASYLDFKYAKKLEFAHNYRSTRFEYLQKFYRPMHIGALNITPEVGVVAIYYSHVPQKDDKGLVAGIFSVDTNLPFYKFYRGFKHVVTPFARYHYYTYPTSAPNDHYIFDVDDGWYRLNMLTFGVQQSFFVKSSEGLVQRALTFDLYANAFFHTKTLPQTFQRVFANLSFNSTERLKHTLNVAWDIAHQQLGRFNLRTDWTASENFAMATEYRYRDAYDWRKADRTNFVLDSFRSVRSLLHSTLSDRRQTLLVHFFFRFHPNWALQVHNRNGWGRESRYVFVENEKDKKRKRVKEREPPYSEFEIDLLGTVHSAWQIKFSYQHRQNDHHRFTVGFNLGLTRPDLWKCEHLVPALNF